MAVQSSFKSFLGSTTHGGGAATLVFTVGTNEVWLVQDIWIAQASGGNAVVDVFHDTNASADAGDRFIAGLVIPTGNPYHYDVSGEYSGIVMLPGHKLYVDSDIANVNFFFYGRKLRGTGILD